LNNKLQKEGFGRFRKDSIDSTVLGMTTIVAMAISLVNLLLMTRYLLPADFGYFQFVIAIISILSILTMWGTNDVVHRDTANGFDGIFLSAICFKLKWGVIVAILTISIGLFFVYSGNTGIGGVLLILAVIFPLGSAFSLWKSLLFGKKRILLLSGFSIVHSLISLVSILVGIILFSKKIELFLVLISLTSVLGEILFALVSFRFVRNTRTSLNWQRQSVALSVRHVVSFLYNYSDRLIIGIVFTFQDLAIYALTISIVAAIRDILSSSSTPFVTKIYRKEDWHRKNTLMIFLLILLGTGIIGGAIHIPIKALFLKPYSQSIPYIRIYLLQLPFVFLTIILEAILIREDMSLELNLFKSLSLFFVFICYVVLIPFIGVWGAILGSMSFYIVESILISSFLFVREHRWKSSSQ